MENTVSAITPSKINFSDKNLNDFYNKILNQCEKEKNDIEMLKWVFKGTETVISNSNKFKVTTLNDAPTIEKIKTLSDISIKLSKECKDFSNQLKGLSSHIKNLITDLEKNIDFFGVSTDTHPEDTDDLTNNLSRSPKLEIYKSGFEENILYINSCLEKSMIESVFIIADYEISMYSFFKTEYNNDFRNWSGSKEKINTYKKLIPILYESKQQCTQLIEEIKSKESNKFLEEINKEWSDYEIKYTKDKLISNLEKITHAYEKAIPYICKKIHIPLPQNADPSQLP